MKLAPRSLFMAVLVCGLAGGMFTTMTKAQSTPPAPAANNPPPTKLAVVNIVDLFDNLTEKKAADDGIDQMKKGYEEENRQLTAKLQVAKDNLPKTFKPGTVEFRKAQDDLLRMAVELQISTQVNQQKLFMELRLRTADIYNKINQSVAAYAQANGIALVFVADNPSVENASTQEQLQAMVTVRKVLYAHPSFDITTAILQKMNTEYELASHPPTTRPGGR
jgi:Skp family chaperone for outer membrane proteins